MLHPQWVVVDLKAEYPISAVRIAWENPYADHLLGWSGWVGKDALDFDGGPKGEWKTFPMGDVKGGKVCSDPMKFAGCAYFDAVCAGIDDGILEYLRRARIGRRSELRWVCDSGDSSGIGGLDRRFC